MKTHFAYFVTPHGFGHAARAAAVMKMIRSQNKDAVFEVFSLVPEWFFADSIPQGCIYHPLKTDIGLIQSNPMSENLPSTLEALGRFFSNLGRTVNQLAKEVKPLGLEAILCDISPMGLELADELGIPGYLVENFTWDWIYEYYLTRFPEFQPYINKFKEIYQKATFHIQTEPVCQILADTLVTRPVSRTPNLERGQIRKMLDISESQKAVLVTMGGIPARFPFLDLLTQIKDVVFIIPGSSERVDFQANLRLLPHHSVFYHPDLMNAADAVLGKAGYSTVAEAYWAGIPFGYFLRSGFRESVPIADYIRKELKGIEFSEADFENGHWVELLDNLMMQPPMTRMGQNGAAEAARLILG